MQIDVEEGKRPFLKQARNPFTTTELEQPVAARFLADEVERLSKENDRLQEYRNKYHVADKQCGVLEEKARAKGALEALDAIGIAVGAVMVGLAPALWKMSPFNFIVIGLGATLLVASVFARVVRVKSVPAARK